MTPYTIALFLHVTGAVGYFISAGARWFNVAALRRAQRVEQVRLIATLDGWVGPLFGISVLLLLAAGLYMAATAWNFQTGWIDVALISVLLIAPIGSALMEPRRRAISVMARGTPDGPIPEPLARRIHDPILRVTAQTLLVLLLGIVFLMTTKPGFGGAIIVMLVALVLGVGSGVLGARSTGSRGGRVAAEVNRASEPAL